MRSLIPGYSSCNTAVVLHAFEDMPQQVDGNTGLLQSIQYRKTGIILNVTPHVTGNQVMLDINAERSSLAAAAGAGAASSSIPCASTAHVASADSAARRSRATHWPSAVATRTPWRRRRRGGRRVRRDMNNQFGVAFLLASE